MVLREGYRSCDVLRVLLGSVQRTLLATCGPDVCEDRWHGEAGICRSLSVPHDSCPTHLLSPSPDRIHNYLVNRLVVWDFGALTRGVQMPHCSVAHDCVDPSVHATHPCVLAFQ